MVAVERRVDPDRLRQRSAQDLTEQAAPGFRVIERQYVEAGGQDQHFLNALNDPPRLGRPTGHQSLFKHAPDARSEIGHEAASAVGLAVDGETVPYVSEWGEDGALEAVTEFAETIDRVARRIEDVLLAAHETTEIKAAAA